MTSACLREKSGWYYIVISYYDEEHKRKQIWEKTEFRIRGNKRKAEELLMEYQRFYDVEKRKLVLRPSLILFKEGRGLHGLRKLRGLWLRCSHEALRPAS